MKSVIFAVFFWFSTSNLYALLNLDDLVQDIVLETKRVQIPAIPYAFNASMVSWKDFILMSFRSIPDPAHPFTSFIGVLLLDKEFNPISEPQFLQTRDVDSPAPSRAEDARLFYVGNKLHIAYSDNPNQKNSVGGYRMVIGELIYNNGLFMIDNASRLVEFEKQSSALREKNWVPFDYQNHLLLAYSISPHLIFQPISNTGVCETVDCTNPKIEWDWGILRGGTPAILLETGEYLSFFHSVKKMATTNSKNIVMPHYFMGAYTFASKPPFQITGISPTPIFGPGFYSGIAYQRYWGSIQCIFPAGILLEQDAIWVSYGRQDHEIWVVRLDKKKLLDSLIPIHKSE
ncbi:MAG TPA: hypothetical protein VLE95_04480 [Chlamydiales bacterium]|nr:hypothetical protein [Chlamydiales bacterium]